MAVETERRRWDGRLLIDGSFRDASSGGTMPVQRTPVHDSY